MDNRDTFGRDPQIQYMRSVFARMEQAQGLLLKEINMTPHDVRLRRFRDMALKLFEKTWAIAMHKGIIENEEGAAILYLYCLSYALSTGGISVPPRVLPENGKIEAFVKEVLK
jgi:hypothetical protein